MKSYCVKEKRETSCVPGSEIITIAKNGRPMMKCKCASCGITKTQFVKSTGAQSKRTHDRYKQLVKSMPVSRSTHDRYLQLVKQQKPTVKKSGAFGWKDNGKSLTQAEKKRRFERYFGPPDKKIMANVEKFANQMASAKDGTTKQRGNFFITKISPHAYDIDYYFFTRGRENNQTKSNFQIVSLPGLKDVLYQIAMGIVVFLR